MIIKNLGLLVVFVIVIIPIMITECVLHSGEITLETLLKKMTNREQLAKFPKPEYTVKQFSSYSRCSRIPEHYTWFANRDNNSFLRTEYTDERREFVLFDAEGSGTVVRIWATFNWFYDKKGTLRFYFDQETEPRIKGEPMELISGGKLVGTPLSFSVPPEGVYQRRGHNLYLPIPYSKHLKITYETDGIIEARDCITFNPTRQQGEEVIFYQINYRKYKPGVNVKTFEMQDLTNYSNIIYEFAL
jgi:hypothetical protein